MAKIQINYSPRAWQEDFHKHIEQKKRAILVLHRRAGKAQPLSAKVLTPNGLVFMGDIKLNDTVLTPKGTKAKVIGIFPQPKQQIYKIILQDGSQTRATAEHLWKIYFANKCEILNTLCLKTLLEQKIKIFIDTAIDFILYKKEIIKIEEDGFEVAQCILIDDPDHLYITDDFIVTHNTTAIVNQLQKDAMLVPDSQYAYICPYKDQAKRVAWDLFKKYGESIPNINFNSHDLTITYPTGSKILLLGSDNAHALRGIGLWGVALDEYAQQPAHLWGEIILPTLTDHKGYAIFLGTPQGKGAFYSIYKKAVEDEKWYAKILSVNDTKIFSPQEIEEIKKECSEDEFNQEWMCSFESSVQGAYYANEINTARTEGRLGIYPWDKNLPVHTVWDIGFSDDTSIGFFQVLHGQVKMIDYYENSGYDISHYIPVLKRKDYAYGHHFGPWDLMSKNFQTGKSTYEHALSLGIKFTIIPQTKLSFIERINAGKQLWSRLFININNCQNFIDTISLYRKKFDKERGEWKDTPVEDYTNHCADMFFYAALAERQMSGRIDVTWEKFLKEDSPKKSILQG